MFIHMFYMYKMNMTTGHQNKRFRPLGYHLLTTLYNRYFLELNL